MMRSRKHSFTLLRGEPEASIKETKPLLFQEGKFLYNQNSGDCRYYFNLPPNSTIKSIIYNPNTETGTREYEINIYTQDSTSPLKYTIKRLEYNNVNIKLTEGGVIAILVDGTLNDLSMVLYYE